MHTLKNMHIEVKEPLNTVTCHFIQKKKTQKIYAHDRHFYKYPFTDTYIYKIIKKYAKCQQYVGHYSETVLVNVLLKYKVCYLL